jgi:hypothetical protein
MAITRESAREMSDEALDRLRQSAGVARRPARVREACMGCGAPATMNASLGPACPDCYDDLSD